MTAALKKHFFQISHNRSPAHLHRRPPSPHTRNKADRIHHDIRNRRHPKSVKQQVRTSPFRPQLKCAFSANPSRFQAVFEACLRLGHHLKEWKTATIEVILKTTTVLPKCYHPVALLECLDKLLERIIAKCNTHDIAALHNTIWCASLFLHD